MNSNESPPLDPANPATALLLPGGGARAAYQVGVLKGIAELINSTGAGQVPTPFSILCGTSAGALNAVALASRADDFQRAVIWLEELWLALAAQQVYRTDVLGLLRNALRLVMSLFNSGISVGKPVALLDNTPLRTLLQQQIDFDAIGRHLHNRHLDAVCVTAMNYSLGTSMSFFQGGPGHAGWQRWRRQGVGCPLTINHLMASTAIPTIFPPERIGQHYFGDGALRQMNPISPALHLGARRVFIIPPNGHRRTYDKPIRKIQSPALGQVLGHLLNSAFIDSLETDIEMLERINELVAHLPQHERDQLSLRLEPVDLFVISPSVDIDTIAELHARELSYAVRSFLRITGSTRYNGGVNISSYLLFTRSYIEQLIALGYADAMQQSTEIIHFINASQRSESFNFA
ncbi:MAG: patatin-like phospholipase family protein, partial [Spongiibacteraceae bacterium]